MSDFSLIALDMDGTLLNSELKITSKTRMSICDAANAGKHIVLSTGRCLSELREHLVSLPQVRFLICESGACVYDLRENRTIYSDPLPENEVRFLLKESEKEHVILQAFHNNQSYINQINDNWMDSFDMSAYRESFRDSAILNPEIFEQFDIHPFSVEKLNFYFDSKETRRDFHTRIKEHDLKTVETLSYLLEVSAATADKGSGLEILCDHIGIPLNNTIAVGDSRNDIEILKTAGLSAAMGNASDDIKSLCDIITEDCDHDGVASVIYNYLLKEKL